MTGRGQLVSWTEDILFTRLDIHDAHWKSSRKTLARAFSADEIRRAQSAACVESLGLGSQCVQLPERAFTLRATKAADACNMLGMC